ncbi:TMEM175 family protein [Lacticaseibacillus saniviri]|uniref:Integral membrane protein n=1 Tax=Lacticaseibacillus saniviri JCM 17471 = DSM 24301 TaxID=1293598 RepID=A0A0R2MPP7_9LACO|nr:TMEM175 family protein [Lacticaseibacillus saniviri]KRO15624.1 hypothetical protein IV56_GL002395 [Lacticaseibacillus saniviri JCM 17471 = DSM 24301]MCG4280787.1 TMEM175 family protein [Lacticaseibacillus saniviri]
MNKGRLEAFTDAIIAIVVTLLVLEIPRPHGYTFSALFVNWRSYIVYIVTFTQLMAVWYNHHNLLKHATNLTHAFYWANTFWLLVLSVAPFATSWLSEYPERWQPEMFYVIVWSLWSLAYTLMEDVLFQKNPQISLIDRYSRWIYYIMAFALVMARFVPLTGVLIVGMLTLWLLLSPIRYGYDPTKAKREPHDED